MQRHKDPIAHDRCGRSLIVVLRMNLIRKHMGRRIVAPVTIAALAFTWGCDRLVTTPSLYGTVEVHVQERYGAPADGATFLLYTGTRAMSYGETDRSGSLIFHDVPQGVYGVRFVPSSKYVRPEDLLGGKPSDVRDNLRVNAGQSVMAQFTVLKAGVGVVVTEVREPDGSPVARIPVALYRSSGTVRNAVTDSAGRFVFDSIPTGNYGVRIARGPAYVDSGEVSITSRDGIFVDDGSRVVVPFEVVPCGGTFSVAVRDEKGTGVPGSIVTVYSATGILDEVRTGADGIQVFRKFPCGSYGVRIRPAIGWSVSEGRGTSFEDGLVFHRGTVRSTTLAVQTVLTRATLRARVTDERGAAVAGAHVLLYTFDGTYRDVLTGPDGVAVVDDIPTDRQYGVRVDPPAGYSVVAGRGSSFFDALTFTNGQLLDVAFQVAHR